MLARVFCFSLALTGCTVGGGIIIFSHPMSHPGSYPLLTDLSRRAERRFHTAALLAQFQPHEDSRTKPRPLRVVDRLHQDRHGRFDPVRPETGFIFER